MAWYFVSLCPEVFCPFRRNLCCICSKFLYPFFAEDILLGLKFYILDHFEMCLVPSDLKLMNPPFVLFCFKIYLKLTDTQDRAGCCHFSVPSGTPALLVFLLLLPECAGFCPYACHLLAETSLLCSRQDVGKRAERWKEMSAKWICSFSLWKPRKQTLCQVSSPHIAASRTENCCWPELSLTDPPDPSQINDRSPQWPVLLNQL